ncbi:MAG: Tfp pilus assembly protein FimT/FimU [Desulfococcaceae bacterium]
MIPHSDARGFSLFEMIVVLIIISLMTVLIVPQLTGTLMKMNAKTSAKKVAASLRYARSRAVAEKIPYVSVFDLDTNRVSVMDYRQWTDISESGKSFFSAKSGAKVYNLPDGVHFEKNRRHRFDNISDQIAFYPTGGCSGGDIVITDEQDRKYTVHADFITGAVEMIE